MAQYIVSITMGTPEFDNRDRLDQCTYHHLHQVFDDYASAKAGFRSAISTYAKVHFGNENRMRYRCACPRFRTRLWLKMSTPTLFCMIMSPQ